MARTKTSSAGELLIELDRDADTSLHCQLEQGIREAIRSGRLAAATNLPSSRALAGHLGLSRGVVVEAYEQLVAEGYLSSTPGGATRVAAGAVERASTGVRQAGRPGGPGLLVPGTPAARIDFRYGRPDVTEFPRQVWLRSLKRVLNEAPSDRLSYLDNRGAEELRVALAAYLNRVRGTCADPERTLICNGFLQGLGIVTRLLRAKGARRLALEDPGQTDTMATIAFAGLDVVPVPVDDGGIVVEALARADADAVLVTPAHQFPTGAVMSAERRSALVAWARSRDALVIEDDYDAEYRYDREPIGAIQGLAPEEVIYAGSASKTLAPGLRLGWLVLPDRLVELAGEIKESTDRGSPSLEQLAFADFLARGDFDHHLRRMRPLYRARRDALLAALERHLPELRPAGASAGLHVIAWLPPDVDEAAVVDRAAAVGVRVYGLRPYHSGGAAAPGGLLFGYGTLTGPEIDEGIRLVAGVVAAARADGYERQLDVVAAGAPA